MRAGPSPVNHKALRWEWRRRRKWRTILREVQGVAERPAAGHGGRRWRGFLVLAREPQGRGAGRRTAPADFRCNYRAPEKQPRQFRKNQAFANERPTWQLRRKAEQAANCLRRSWKLRRAS